MLLEMPLRNRIKHPSKLFLSHSMRDGLNMSTLQPPSDLSRSISNKSVTFATIFDDLPLVRDVEEQDLVIVVPDKYVIDEPTVSSSSVEPYPFRSERPLHSSFNPIASGSKKRFQAFHSLHRSKKSPRPTKTEQSLNRSTSAPTSLFSLASLAPRLINEVKDNAEHQRPWKTVRRWMKSSSVGRFVQSVVKHPHLKSKSRCPTTLIRDQSDLIY